MKFVITAVIVIGLFLGVRLGYQYWESSQATTSSPGAGQPPVTETSGDSLPGLPAKLQPMFDAAQQRGAAGLGDFLKTYEKSVSDPRLAWIQLDYVVLIVKSDPAAARQMFAKVRDRLTPDSPVYNRMKELEPTYQ